MLTLVQKIIATSYKPILSVIPLRSQNNVLDLYSTTIFSKYIYPAPQFKNILWILNRYTYHSLERHIFSDSISLLEFSSKIVITYTFCSKFWKIFWYFSNISKNVDVFEVCFDAKMLKESFFISYFLNIVLISGS